MGSRSFNAVLLEISNQLSGDQLEALKYLCTEIGKKTKEKCTTGIQLFTLLTERDKLGADNTDYLCGLLRDINREDLSQKLEIFNGGGPVNRSDELDHVIEILAQNLGRNWRKLGRKLGLSEVKLESIGKKHPTDLEETAVELVKEWRTRKREEATVGALIKALRDCDFNLTADTVEDRLAARTQTQ